MTMRLTTSLLFDNVRGQKPNEHEEKIMKTRHDITREKCKHTVKAIVDSAPPAPLLLPHLAYSPNKIMKQQEKLQSVEMENLHLLGHMRKTMVKGSDPHNMWNVDFNPNRSLQYHRTIRRLIAVAHENIRILKHLQDSKGNQLLKQWANHWQLCRTVGQKIKKYDNEWKEHKLQRTAQRIVERSVTDLLKEWGGQPKSPMPLSGCASSSAFSRTMLAAMFQDGVSVVEVDKGKLPSRQVPSARGLELMQRLSAPYLSEFNLQKDRTLLGSQGNFLVPTPRQS